MLGLVVGEGTRTVQPGKAQALKDWPDPKALDDVVSFRAFANYLRDFILRFQELDQRLKSLTKKGARFDDWLADGKNMEAFREMRNALADTAALHMPDLHAAQDVSSGRPLELYVDACEYGWGCTLAQRETKGGAPKPIACYSKSFSPTEQAWSTFERELSGLKEAIIAVDPLVHGFPLIVYTDHRNNLFTGSLLANRRMQKKLLRWSLELDELCKRVQRVWIAGKDNILGDAPSRNPKDRDIIKDLPVPGGPVKRVIRAMFEAPVQLEEEMAQLSRFLQQLESEEPDAVLSAGGRPPGHGPAQEERAAVEELGDRGIGSHESVERRTQEERLPRETPASPSPGDVQRPKAGSVEEPPSTLDIEGHSLGTVTLKD